MQTLRKMLRKDLTHQNLYSEVNIVLPIAKNKKVIHLMKDDLKGRYQNMLLH